MVRLTPGDPVIAQYGLKLHEIDPEKIETVHKDLGLDDPLHIQYIRYLNNLFRGDLGVSVTSKLPVIEEIGSRFPVTLELAIATRPRWDHTTLMPEVVIEPVRNPLKEMVR